MRRISEWFRDFVDFVTVKIWRMPLDELPRMKSFLIKQLRIILLAVRGYNENKVQLRASALTFYSLLSVVPVAAMVFGIAKGFGFQERLISELAGKFHEHQEVFEWIINFAEKLLVRANGGFIAGVGLVILFWTVMMVLGNIENSFNSIWQIRKSRVLVRKFSDYLAIMLVSPVFIFLSSSVTVFIQTQFEQVAGKMPALEHFHFLLSLVPYVLVWLLFTIIYMVMPNTRVKLKSALIAGIIAGTIFQITQWAYINFQIGVNRYGAIYGSFAAIPLFIIWLQVSWSIVLIGAEISFANQNVDRYEFESDARHISPYFKRLVSLLVVNLIVKNFARGLKPFTASEISAALKIPIRVIREVLYELVESGIFTEAMARNIKERAYQPGIDINQITIEMVVKKLDEMGSPHITVSKSPEYHQLSRVLESFANTMKESPSNMLLKDI